MSNPTGPTKPGKQRGCLFYGCLSLAVLALVIALFVSVGFYFAKRTFTGWVNDYTEAAPRPIEVLVYPEPRLRELQTRLQTFHDGLEKSGEPLELVLSADDLNALIAQKKDLKGRVFVKIDDDQLKGEVSWPLPDLGPMSPVKLKGRYLNGTAAFKVNIDQGNLDVRIEQASVKDKPLPPVLANELRKKNLAEDARLEDDPETAKVLNKIDRLEIRDGKIIIRSKAGTDPTPVPPPPPAPAPAPAVKP